VNSKSLRFKAADIIYLCMAILPFVVGMVIKVLTTPPSEGIAISGARVFFEVKMPLQNLLITESQVNSWLVIISLLGLCLYFTHGLSPLKPSKRQISLPQHVLRVITGLDFYL